MSKSYQKVIVMGDFNARTPKLDTQLSKSLDIEYENNPDTGINTNGKDLHDLCVCCLLIT